MKRLQDLREKRNRLINAAREIMNLAAEDGRDTLNAEEEERYNKIWEDQGKLADEIKREEELIELERKSAERAAESAAENGGDQASEEDRAAALMGTFRGFLSTGRIEGEGLEEFRALQANTDTQGGFLVAPEQFVNQLIKFVDDMLYIRQLATTFPVPNAMSMGAPSLDADPADSDWTAELGTGSEDSTMAFGKRELYPHPLAKRIKVSNKLLRSGVLNVEQLVRERLAYKFGVTEEKAFLTGSGVQQPLGLFTASNDGISTGRDVATGNTSTAITMNGLKSAEYALKMQYRRSARWLFHRDGMAMIAKLREDSGAGAGTGGYLWQPSTQAGEPDRLLGKPVIESEYVPNTFTTGLYVGMLADFSHYWIVDALDMQIQRLVELYAETNQTGFIGRRELDGMPTLEEAFVRVTLG